MADDKLMKRRAIRKAELRVIYDRQQAIRYGIPSPFKTTIGHMKDWLWKFALCECGCKRRFDNENSIEYDHKIPNAMLFEGGKVDWQILRSDCHKVKSAKDVKDIAKAKRMGGETGQAARRKRKKAEGRHHGIPSPANPWGKSRKMQTKNSPRVDRTKYYD